MLMPGIFLGVQFQAHVFFWVRNMKLRLTPRHLYCEYPPPPLGNIILHRVKTLNCNIVMNIVNFTT